MKDTQDIRYTERLEGKETGWKKLLDVQRPYRANLARLNLGHVLDIGCGIGRNLDNLKKIGATAVGVDHNTHSVALAKKRGLLALSSSDFKQEYGIKLEIFDSFLISHVIEHMTSMQAVDLISSYRHLLKPEGRVVLITPQERGFATDETHIEFMDFEKMNGILTEAGLCPSTDYSFPFPRAFGTLFTHNEFVSIGTKPA